MKNYFEWNEEHSIGIEVIDAQHKDLVKIMNKLFTAINEHSADKVIDEILASLIEYTDYHFSTEEKYFKEFEYADADEHIKEHKRFYEKIKTLQEKQKNREIETSFELIDFLEDWLLEHIRDLDRKYVPCFKSHGLK